MPPFYPMFACVDPDPYSENGSGSRKLPNTDPIQIRIHNTEKNITFFDIASLLKTNSHLCDVSHPPTKQSRLNVFIHQFSKTQKVLLMSHETMS